MKEIIVRNFNDSHICKIDINDLCLERVTQLCDNETYLFSFLSQGRRCIMYEVTYYKECPHFEVKVLEVKRIFIAE